MQLDEPAIDRFVARMREGGGGSVCGERGREKHTLSLRSLLLDRFPSFSAKLIGAAAIDANFLV